MSVNSTKTTQATHDPTHALRHDWPVDEILEMLNGPLDELVFRAQSIHRIHHPNRDVQLASLLSIKTGGCPEDCAYCPQSAHYDTGLQKEALLDRKTVAAAARKAKKAGATRFCMGAAWRHVKDGPAFDSVLDMVRDVRALGMEACVTLGMLTARQAQRLAEAGLTAYNHNLDTSPEFYGSIISTRNYDERLETLHHARDAGLDLCCGGIVGLGESPKDRARMIQILAQFDPHPESVPINALVRAPGTPLAERPPVDPLDMVRLCAVARITMPQSRVRLSAGRKELSREAQILCFLAGANSIFYGDQLLTTGNPDTEQDLTLLREMGLAVESATDQADHSKQTHKHI